MLDNRTAVLNERHIAKLLGLTFIFLAGVVVNTPLMGQCRYRPPSPRLPVGLRFTIRAEKQVAEVSRPVIIHFELSNESNAPIKMRDNLWSALDYELHVRDARGKEAPLTKWGSQIRTGPIQGSGNDVTLAPGEKYTDQQDLSRIYDISLPGDYSVQACRALYMWGNIYSNKIVIPFVFASLPAAK